MRMCNYFPRKDKISAGFRGKYLSSDSVSGDQVVVELSLAIARKYLAKARLEF